MKPLYFAFCALCCWACSGENPNTDEVVVDDVNSFVETIPDTSIQLVDERTESPSYSFVVIDSDSSRFGYQIFEGDKVLITQPHIPAIQGRKGFKSEDYASITAEFAIYKLENGVFPPTISIQELDSLGVLE